ncbi:MAG: enoyl-CoA hydratase-related protein [Solirubrobacterales bacterium]
MADVTSIETGTEKVRLDFPAEAVARLKISNPPKRNALDHEILDAITATVPRLDQGIEVRCLVITGEDPVFSAGYDIGGIPAESFETDAEARRPPIHRRPRRDRGLSLADRRRPERSLPRRSAGDGGHL